MGELRPIHGSGQVYVGKKQVGGGSAPSKHCKCLGRLSGSPDSETRIGQRLDHHLSNQPLVLGQDDSWLSTAGGCDYFRFT